HGDNWAFIVDRYWLADQTAPVWLIFGETYNVRVGSASAGPIDIGPIIADSQYVKTISPGVAAMEGEYAEVRPITEEIAWRAWFDESGFLRIWYQDNTGGTNQVRIRVYEGRDLVWQDVQTGSGWESIWTGADNGATYSVHLEIDHDVYGFSPVRWSGLLIGGLPPSILPSEWPDIGDPPVPWSYLFTFGALMVVILTFGPSVAGIGCIAVGVIASFLKLLLGIAVGWEIISLIIVVGFLVQLAERRRGD
ncbi:MAG: hypothetical protein JRD89_20100, partial [Deltaproteobacteria bacterium]|nr:hypothetical protein [Deltaproteobacteria bacterium]